MTDANSAARVPHVRIFIDGEAYEVRAEHMTAGRLRRVPQPPIPAERQIWLDVPDGPDRPLGDGESIHLTPDMRFFSEPEAITIHIDRVAYVVTSKRMTGQELRAVPTPPVGQDRDLWLDRVDQQDKKINDHESVRLRDGMRFFTAPGRINPGCR